jgi:acyl-CoA thioesterase
LAAAVIFGGQDPAAENKRLFRRHEVAAENNTIFGGLVTGLALAAEN